MSRSIRLFWKFYFIGIASVIVFFFLLSWGVFGKMPSMDEIQNPSASLASQVYAEDGTLLGKFYLEDRINVKYRDISKHIIQALVATEDERFYDHSGIDAKALARAFVFLGKEGGASTITMQTAKNLFTENWSTRNFVLRGLQKLKEGIIAVKLEQNLTKEEIITLYLNTVSFSDNVYGIRNAAKTFFQKEPDRINVEEAAVLIGMLKAATLYNPRRNPRMALERRNTVINQMVRNNYITDAEASILKQKPIQLNYKKLDEKAGLGPYFRMVLGEEMKKWCKEHKKPNGEPYNLYKDGLKIYTSINPRMQIYAEEAVDKHMAYLQQLFNSQSNIKTGAVWKGYENILTSAMKASDRWKNLSREGLSDEDIKKTFFEKTSMKVFSWNSNREKDTIMTPYDSIKYAKQFLQTGFMVMDPLNGQIKAWVGGINFKYFKYDHVNVNTKRQVGSSIKPLLYSLAIQEDRFSPNSIVQDVQQNFGGYGLVPATSRTCSGGSMTMASALAWSKNCATAYILKQLDPEGNNGARRFTEFLKECRVETEVEPYPSIALGSCEISLYEMMQAYTMFPGRGFNVKPMMIMRIEDRNGNILEQFQPNRKEVLNEVAAYSTAMMMQGVIQKGTGRGLWGYGVSGEIAGKTGTTNNNSDAWFIGYTPQLLAGVWVGGDHRFLRFDSKSGEGSRSALPIWGHFYSKASADPNCGIDRNMKFLRPEVMSNDLIIDWMNNTSPSLGAEGEDVGAGTSNDYEMDEEMYEVPVENKPKVPATNNTPPPAKEKEAPKTNTEADKPKAILPPKKPGGR